MIPYGRQDIDDADIAAVTAVLRSDYLTQGPAVPAFEAAVAKHVGAVHALAMNSATSALHVAYLALGVGPGDRVWTSPITFVATANAALYCGAEVDFVDVDPVTGNMSVTELDAKLAQAARDGTLPKVVVPVHLTGRSCDMAAIADLGRRYGFRIVEDASHAIGGSQDGGYIGACHHSDICIFSFHPVKIVTTGEGGMALTQDADLAERMALLRSHGITRNADRYRCDDQGGWYYEQVDLGFNYRMTDIQAALGESQVRRLTQFIDRRRAIAARYDAMLADLPLQRPPVADQFGGGSSWHLYSIRIDGSVDGVLRRQWFDALRARGILVQVHYIPVHHQPWYRDKGFRPGMCPAAERYYASTLSLPMFSALTDAQQDQVVSAIAEIAGGL